ncbi:MAG: hypothetical protein GWN09_04540 [Gammaproteobacteria bacterium]|nr:hypothetical protein [Gammaproteobacteria bacterium]
MKRESTGDDGLGVETGKTGKRLLFEWSPELHAVIDRAKTLRGDVASMHLLCTRNGQRYTSSGFQAMWRRLMKCAVEIGLIAERFTFYDIRAKSASDSDDDRLLGHEDRRTLNCHYKRKAVRVTPLKPKILDDR